MRRWHFSLNVMAWQGRLFCLPWNAGYRRNTHLVIEDVVELWNQLKTDNTAKLEAKVKLAITRWANQKTTHSQSLGGIPMRRDG
jgi:hypothetical protein